MNIHNAQKQLSALKAIARPKAVTGADLTFACLYELANALGNIAEEIEVVSKRVERIEKLLKK